MNKILLALILIIPLANAGTTTLRDNVIDICMQKGMQQFYNFSVWDYDLTYKSHQNNNYTVMYRHEDYQGRYLRCLYVRASNQIEWNTMNSSGRISVPKGFHNKSMTLTLN